jgi:hypothetical protein
VNRALMVFDRIMAATVIGFLIFIVGMSHPIAY